MRSIFFDLETSDRDPVGQILNFSFIVVSDRWEIEEEFSGDIHLSRLQIPSPQAILANRVDIVSHQKRATLSERDAAAQIAQFLDRVVRESPGQVALVGYNSSRFDVPYLRTTLIRNGVNPYVGTGKLLYRDLYAAARKLSVSHREFPRQGKRNAEASERGAKLSLKLETIAHALSLLDGQQVHAARDDVILTIAVARFFHETFGLDVRTYESYEAISSHQPSCRGRLYSLLEPQYDLSKPDLAERVPMLLLDFDRRYSLWINLNRYAAGEGRRCVQFFKNQGSSFVLDTEAPDEPGKKEIAAKAMAEFSTVNLRNFFQRSKCDVEQDIFRVDFDGIDALGAAIWQDRRDAVKNLANKDVTALCVRNVIANHKFGSDSDEAVRGKLKQYALHRYGGKMLLSKYSNPEEGIEPRYSAALSAVLQEIDQLSKDAPSADLDLLASLRSYIQDSDIVAVAGTELL